jgi:hypothetical protein
LRALDSGRAQEPRPRAPRVAAKPPAVWRKRKCKSRKQMPTWVAVDRTLGCLDLRGIELYPHHPQPCAFSTVSHVCSLHNTYYTKSWPRQCWPSASPNPRSVTVPFGATFQAPSRQNASSWCPCCLLLLAATFRAVRTSSEFSRLGRHANFSAAAPQVLSQVYLRSVRGIPRNDLLLRRHSGEGRNPEALALDPGFRRGDERQWCEGKSRSNASSPGLAKDRWRSLLVIGPSERFNRPEQGGAAAAVAHEKKRPRLVSQAHLTRTD